VPDSQRQVSVSPNALARERVYTLREAGESVGRQSERDEAAQRMCSLRSIEHTRESPSLPVAAGTAFRWLAATTGCAVHTEGVNDGPGHGGVSSLAADGAKHGG
jgi:hypothetical protein